MPLGYRDTVALRVLHVSTYAGNGGAGRAASSLHQAMVDEGVESRMLTASGTRFRITSELDRRMWSLQRSPRVTWRSPARFGCLTAQQINASAADVVNLHWVTDGFLSVEQIGRITKPIVWTMHDMWPFTGTEHYTFTGSRTEAHPHEDGQPPRWVEGYTRDNRPGDESGWDLDRWTWERKRRSWVRPPHLIPVSSWLGGLAGQSALARNWPTTVIPNVMPIQTFAPQDKSEVRRQLGLPASTSLIAFTASAGIGDDRKGWRHLRDALHVVRRRFPDVCVIVIGPHHDHDDPGIDIPIHWQGEIQDDARMAQLIAAADVVAVPSEMDNLPMTACEAQTAGRPVVAFDVGGLPDIVTHLTTGYLARAYDVTDLADGLSQALDEARTGARWGAAARTNAQSRWSAAAVVDQYLRVYEQAVSGFGGDRGR